jgi:hypothetical protein
MAVVRNPTVPKTIVPARPPGTAMTPGRRSAVPSLMNEANRYRYGMK